MNEITRNNVNALKEKLNKTKCLNKFYDALEECIRNHADGYADDMETTPEMLAIALEEIAFDFEYNDEDLREKGEEEKEL